jgi:Domain of unknown function (DUF4915)
MGGVTVSRREGGSRPRAGAGARYGKPQPAPLPHWRGYALVATSLPRDGAFKGLELEDNVKARDGEPRCGAYIIDTRNGDILHWIRFEGAVRELFDAAFIPGVRAPMCVGLGNPEMPR